MYLVLNLICYLLFLPAKVFIVIHTVMIIICNRIITTTIATLPISINNFIFRLNFNLEIKKKSQSSDQNQICNLISPLKYENALIGFFLFVVITSRHSIL